MIKSEVNRRRVRKSFSQIESIMEMPDLIDVQVSSYKHFLQEGVPADKRQDVGLQAVFTSVFPIHDFAGRGDFSEIFRTDRMTGCSGQSAFSGPPTVAVHYNGNMAGDPIVLPRLCVTRLCCHLRFPSVPFLFSRRSRRFP